MAHIRPKKAALEQENLMREDTFASHRLILAKLSLETKLNTSKILMKLILKDNDSESRSSQLKRRVRDEQWRGLYSVKGHIDMPENPSRR